MILLFSRLSSDFSSAAPNSFDGFTIIDPVDKRTPNLLILEIGESAQKEMDNVEELLSRKLTGEIFLTSDYADTNLLKKAMRIGVNEYFSQPIDKDEVIHALRRLVRIPKKLDRFLLYSDAKAVLEQLH